MREAPTSPDPLKGPLRMRDVFFSQRSAPLIAHRPQSRLGRFAFWITGGLVGMLIWWVMREIHPRDAVPFLFAVTLFSFVIGELAGGLIGAGMTQSKFQAWVRQGRLPELHLTCLRPLEIGQLLIASAVGHLPRFLWLCWGAFLIALLAHHPGQAMFGATMAVMVLNGILSLQEQAWIGLTIQAGLGKGLRSVLALMHQTGVQLLTQIPILMLLVMLMVVGLTIADHLGWREEDFFEVHFHWIIFAVAPPHWALKWLFARAHAARFERVVMPNLEM